MQLQDTIFTLSVTCASRTLILRDRVLGRLKRVQTANSQHAQVARHSMRCGKHMLDAVLVRPSDTPAQAALLICHGIGETVDHWFAAQSLLAAHGIASLVFDYAGYGRSRGAVEATRCEENALSAFAFLETLVPGMPISLLGFSMGSGIAAAIAGRVPAQRLILCSAFTSFRDAARILGVPGLLASALPPVWNGEDSLRGLSIPVLVVHCQRDRVFPPSMAAALAAWAGPSSELVIVPNHAHNEPFYRPQLLYWEQILTRVVSSAPAVAARTGNLDVS